MKNALLGCAIVLAATLAMIVVWWLLATHVFGTGDVGPSVGHHAAAVTSRSTAC